MVIDSAKTNFRAQSFATAAPEEFSVENGSLVKEKAVDNIEAYKFKIRYVV